VRDASEWIDKQGAAAKACARLRAGENIALLLDEHGGPRGTFVPFFGRLASTRKTAAVLSLATGAPIVVGACVRRRGQPFLFRVALLEPDLSGADPGRAAADLTARIVSTYESWIRDAPLQWRWIHWRWKARPDGTEERYTRTELRAAFQEDAPHAGQAAGERAS
jgi:KDO2-lipid IV(A) lauroyltransferase